MTRNSNLEPLNLVTSGCFLYRKNNTVEGVRCSGRGSIPDVVILPIVYPKYKKAIIPHVQKLLGGHLIMSDNSHGICGSLPSYTWKGKEKKRKKKKKRKRKRGFYVCTYYITLYRLLGWFRWDQVSHERNFPLTLGFPVYGVHSDNALINYQNHSIHVLFLWKEIVV